jgi:hypothetical protein
MTYPAEYRPGKIKAQIADVAYPVVDIIAKQIQKKHIADNVPKPTVQKGITYKLPQNWSDRSKHKLVRPGPKHLIRAAV